MPLLSLLIALVGAFIISLIACGIALRLSPHFRSGERKEGIFRADQSMNNSSGGSLVLKQGRRVSSSELPLIGSRGMVPAILIAGAGAGWLMNFNEQQWILLGIFGATLCGLWIVGFVDDWKKVHSGHGTRELTKFIGVALVAVGIAVALLELVPQAGIAYSPYIDVPGVGPLIAQIPHAWDVFFVVLVVGVISTTSLAVDFSDGLDGLTGGLIFPAALAFGIIELSEGSSSHFPLVVAALALAGAAMGYLPWNWPSSWKGRSSTVKRRARLIMGDSGSLSLGGLLAIIALADRQELLLLVFGGVFVLEGLSAVIQSRFLVKFFRRFLRVERFAVANVWFPHTEFPLPFLATPMHHHFDLLGWDRKRLVYSAWTIGAFFVILGLVSAMAPFTWERYLARGLVLLLAVALWQSGHHTRGYFVGIVSTRNGQRLGLFYGYPYRLFRWPLYALVEQVDIDAANAANPAEQNALWVRTNVFDARATLGYYCYHAGYLALAREQWERIPYNNLAVRPQIQEMLTDARRRMADPPTVSEAESAGTIETAMGAEPSPADSSTARRLGLKNDQHITGPLTPEAANAMTLPVIGPTGHQTMPGGVSLTESEIGFTESWPDR